MQNWQIKKFDEICEIKIGGTPRRGVNRYWTNGVYPWVAIFDLSKNGKEISQTEEKITKAGVDESNAKLLPKGTLLFSFKLSIGKLAFAGVDLYTNEAIAGLIVKDKNVLDKNFLYYFLQQMSFETAQKAVKGNTLNKEKIKNLQIPLPPIGEQKKIVAKLEKLLAKIKEAKRLRTEAQEATQNLLSAELHKIFEEGKKKGWEEKELGAICELNPKKSELKNKADDFLVSFVPMAGVDEYAQKIIYYSERLLREVRKGYTYFRDGDVLFAKITPCMENGKVAVAKNLKNGIGFGTTEFHVIRAKDIVLPEWIYYIIRQPFFRDAAKQRMTGSAGQKRVPIQFLEKYKIPLPPIAEQKKIVARLDSLSEKIKKLQEYQKATKTDLKNLEQSILHHVFGGELI